MGQEEEEKKRKTKTEILTKCAIFQCPQDKLRANFTSQSVGRYFRNDADLKIKGSKKNALVSKFT